MPPESPEENKRNRSYSVALRESPSPAPEGTPQDRGVDACLVYKFLRPGADGEVVSG